MSNDVSWLLVFFIILFLCVVSIKLLAVLFFVLGIIWLLKHV